MYEKIIILTVLFLIHFISLPGQCGHSLEKKISFLRDSSGLSAAEQIKILSLYETAMDTCPHNHDSVHVMLLRRIGNLFYSEADYSRGINYYQRSIGLINKNAANP